MSEEDTQSIPDGRCFEERVFARFDSLDLRIDSTDSRLDAVESRLESMDLHAKSRKDKSERESTDEHQIWERVLAQLEEFAKELHDFRDEVRDLFRDFSSKFDVLGNDMLQLRADQTHFESRIGKLESDLQK